MALNGLRKTCDCKAVLVPRVLGGLPLTAFGAMHLFGMMPMEPLVEAAGLPAPGMTAIAASLGELVAGLMLLTGAFARVGGLIGIGTMIGALVTHIKIPNDQWPIATTDALEGPWPEPTWMMGLAGLIIVCAATVLWMGGGAMSIDLRSLAGSKDASGKASADTSGE